ncbi:lysine--tRNA ligase, cytoplasmic-like [Rhodamnia argentea]|uniref:Lysine--tRNA ligase, cytoplasmic-like n=1 Tax=Rhodamnia argentea TaxID=178133 RepID=A0A8B8NUZ8_9MYRT|nr:lysine--tRNA ligase, cytoplasmic-like [Rhodamnia argentea]
MAILDLEWINPVCRQGKFPVSEIWAADDEDMDPTYLDAQKTDGKNPYPHEFQVSMSISEYIGQYGDLNNGERREDVAISLRGRIMSNRSSALKLFSYDLHGDGAKVQVMADASVKLGDFVGITGFPGKTRRGGLSIYPKFFEVLSHYLHMMPRQKAAQGSENANVKEVPGIIGLRLRMLFT